MDGAKDHYETIPTQSERGIHGTVTSSVKRLHGRHWAEARYFLARGTALALDFLTAAEESHRDHAFTDAFRKKLSRRGCAKAPSCC